MQSGVLKFFIERRQVFWDAKPVYSSNHLRRLVYISVKFSETLNCIILRRLAVKLPETPSCLGRKVCWDAKPVYFSNHLRRLVYISVKCSETLDCSHLRRQVVMLCEAQSPLRRLVVRDESSEFTNHLRRIVIWDVESFLHPSCQRRQPSKASSSLPHQMNTEFELRF